MCVEKGRLVSENNDPFHGLVPETIPLTDPPLAGVLVQVRFPEILSIAKKDFVADFQEKIRRDYPINQQDDSIVLQLTSEGAKQSTSPNWRFFDVNQEWRLSLTTNFITLETRNYSSRTDFTQRIGKIAQALSTTIKPAFMTRIGVRYINRIYGVHLENMESLLNPEVIGFADASHREKVIRTMHETVSETEEGVVVAKWGYMPKSQTHEPDMMPAVAADSWFLDVDVYEDYQKPMVFDANQIEQKSMELATRSYGVFRWAVKDDFLRVFGGDL